MNKKYELIDESVVVFGYNTLYRIKALRDFSDVKEGDLGGFIEKESNLSHGDKCWVYGNAHVSGNAHVYGNARVNGDAQVCGYAWIFGNSKISGNCILKFNDFTYLRDLSIDYGIWIDTLTIDNKEYIISNTLEKLYIGDVKL